MKALKYYGNKKNSAFNSEFFKPAYFLAASLATTLGCLGIASAQTESVQVDAATCQALNDSTALDQDSIKTRIACYSRDVEHLNGLVSQLMTERNELTANADSQSETIDEYKQELANRQDAMQRLEERAAELRQQVDEVTTDRNQVREQLFNMIAEGKDQPVEVEANKILFENFSESYVTLTTEIEELRERLQEFEATNTELSDQQLATQIENQQLQSEQQELTQKIATLEESVASLQQEKEALEANLNAANSEIETIQGQLVTNEEVAQQQLGEIENLKTALEDSEAQRLELESTIASLNEAHLQEVTEINSRTNELNDRIESLKEAQLALETEAAQSTDELQSTITARDEEITTLASARKELNAERESLISKVTALESTHLEETQGYQEEAGQLQQQIAALTSERSNLGSQLEEQKSLNEQLKAYAEQSDSKSEALNMAADDLRQKLDAANNQASDLQASIDDLDQQSSEDKTLFSEQVAALNSTIEQSQQDRDNLAAELDTIIPQLQIAEEGLAASEMQNEELLASVQTLEDKLLQASEDQQSLQAALLETESESLQANEDLASLKDNADTLSSLLAMSRAHSKNADATLAELRAEMNEADQDLQTKQRELEVLLAEKTRIENEFKAMSAKATTLAANIETALREAGQESVRVSVGEDNAIDILLGSGQLFRTGSARLSSDGQKVLSDLAQTFELAADRRITISGHSDNVPLGTKLEERYKDNWGLSMARALATANFFTDEADVTADRMTVSGFGATQPVADNDTEEGRQQNRRVEISLIPEDSTMASAE